MSEEVTKIQMPENTEEKQPEGLRLAELLFRRTPIMVGDYKAMLQGKGGLLTSSMTYAYNKGLNDALKLIMKEMEKTDGKVKKQVS